jgi:hypothetical protein
VAGANEYTELNTTNLTMLGVRPYHYLGSASKTKIPVMSLESFRDVLMATPWAKTLVFQGWLDPLTNPFTLAMIHLAHQKRPNLLTALHTNIFQLKNRFSDVLESPLNTLIVHVGGHRPSAFSDLTNLPASRFAEVENILQSMMVYVRERRHQFDHDDHHEPFTSLANPRLQKLAQRLPSLRVELSLTIDCTWIKEIHDMIAWADSLGVDGIRFENHPAMDRRIISGSLLAEQQEAEAILQSLEASSSSHLQIALPRLPLDVNSTIKPICSDIFHRVTVDSSLSVSACSERSLFQGRMGHLGESKFWQNRWFTWLRQAHSAEHFFSVPNACMNCPRGNPEGRKILNSSVIEWLPLVELD